MANPKDPRQPKRERLSGDDLEVPVQTRERLVRKSADFRVTPDPAEVTSVTQPPQKAAVRTAPIPLIPPEPNHVQPTGKTKPGLQPKYAGTIIDEARQRQATGRIGQPQPPAPAPERPVAQMKSNPLKPGVAAEFDSGAATKPLRTHQSAEADRPATQRLAQERIRHILPNALEQEQRLAAHEERQPQSAQRRSAPVPVEEWPPYAPAVVGPHQLLILCLVISVISIWGLFYTPLGTPLGFYTGPLTLSEWVNQTIGMAPSAPQPVKLLGNPRVQPMSAPVGETSIVQPPSMTAEQIDAVLSSYGSPAVGSGKDFYDLGVEYGIDPAYAVAFFIHESSAGTNAGWAGLKPDGSTTHNIGNIICAGYPTCYNRFRDYPSWSEGINDWYKLIAVEYINGRGAYTVEQIIPVYAPSFENNVPAYIQAVNALVQGWRQGNR